MVRTTQSIATIVLVALTQSCFERTVDESKLECNPGFSQVCYSGDPGTRDVGICNSGLTLCVEEDGEFRTECFGESLPEDEICDGRDNDCDGISDEDGVCAEESVESLQAVAGTLQLFMIPDRVGPALINKPTWGTIQDCGGLDPLDCASEFLAIHSAVYGLTEDFQGFSLVGQTDVEGTTFVKFRQIQHNIPVSGSWASVVIRQDRIRSIHARVLPSPPASDFLPSISEEVAADVIPKDASDVSMDEVTYYTSLDDSEPDATILERYRFQLSYRFTYRDTSGVLHLAHVDAHEGVVLNDQALSLDAIDPAISMFDNTVPTNAPYSAGTAVDEAFDMISNEFVLWASYEDILSQPDVRANMAIHTDATTGSCGTGSLGYYDLEDGVFVCQGLSNADFEETLRHEANHWLVNEFWQNGYIDQDGTSDSYDGDHREHNALVEFFAQIGCEILQCYQSDVFLAPGANCNFVHLEDLGQPGSGRDFKPVFTMDDMMQQNTSDDSLQKYEDGRVVGSAMYGFYKLASANGQRIGLYKLMTLYLSSFHSLPPGEMLFQDYFIALQQTCNTVLVPSGAVFTLPGPDGVTFSFSSTDCNALDQAFVAVGIASNCALTFPEECNGVDDDCDGITDECTGYDDCCWPIELSNMDDPSWNPNSCDPGTLSMTDGTMMRYCYTGPPGTVGIGTCHSGYSQCVDGAWTQDCVNEAAVTQEGHETLEGDYSVDDWCSGLGSGGIDNNCDGIVDEGCPCNPFQTPAQPCGPSDDNNPDLWGGHCTTGINRCEWNAANQQYEWSSYCYADEWGSIELCDGLDNDCNGIVDDDPAYVGNEESCVASAGAAPGDPVPLGWCALHGHFECPTGVGHRVCMPGGPSDEECDFEDRNCNGIPGAYDIVIAASEGNVPQKCVDLVGVGGSGGALDNGFAIIFSNTGLLGEHGLFIEQASDACHNLGNYNMDDKTASMILFADAETYFVLYDDPCNQSQELRCWIQGGDDPVIINDFSVLHDNASGDHFQCEATGEFGQDLHGDGGGASALNWSYGEAPF